MHGRVSSNGGKSAAKHRPIPHDVKKAIEFMRRAAGGSISLPALARHCGVPPRTLSAHFRDFLGMSPMQYLRRLRFAAAREALLTAEPDVSVTEIARRSGFQHFGRFATEYRRAYDESPSATLRSARTARRERTNEIADAIALPLGSRDRPSIAIVPCQAPANEPAMRAFVESVAEALAASLCSIRSLAVLTPKSLGTAVLDPQRVARDLGARYFLTGRLQREDKRLRLILALVETASGEHVWGDSFDGDHDRQLELQDSVVAGVGRAIPPHIRGAEIERARRAVPHNLDAYGLAMRALPFVFASRPDATRRALELLHRAIEIDPDYALATALAAWCHGQLVMYNGTSAPAEETARALWLVRRAAILDEDDPLVLAARCAVHTMAHEFEEADALIARSLALDPSSGWAWGRSAWLRAYRGESNTAIAQFRRALEREPGSTARANSFAGIGSAHFSAGRYETAACWLRRALAEQPGAAWANRSLSVSYARLGERLRARESLDALRRFCPDLTVGRVVAAVPFRPEFLDRLGDGLSDLGLPP